MKIGVFDSGVGGLTVLCELIKILPSNEYIYFGDVARVPYGNRSNERILQYAIDDVEFLLSKNVDIIIVACGTVSAVALPELKKIYNTIPIYGVIEPVIEYVIKQNNLQSIAVIGTNATVESGVFKRISTMTDNRIEIFQQACPLFVPLIENGILYDNKIALDVADLYLYKYINLPIEILIMGCTHYPLYEKLFKHFFTCSRFLNMGRIMAHYLKENGIVNNASSSFSHVEYYLSELCPSVMKAVNIIDSTISISNIKIVKE